MVREHIEARLSFRPLHDERLDPAAFDMLGTNEARAKADEASRAVYREDVALLRAGEKPAWAVSLLARAARVDES